jgi:sulfatase maturation enzyme AslB (radical SAM superfamily)
LNKDSPLTILASLSYQLVREEMLGGKEPSACSRCYQTERSGVESKRIFEIESHFGRNETFDTEELVPKFIELRLGNLCNLQCVTCNPISSRLLSKTFTQIKELKFINSEYAGLVIDDSWTENELFWNDLLLGKEHLQKIYINGGEPTLISMHWKFLDRLISLDVAKNIELHYNINATNMKQQYIDTWGKFKMVVIGCSVDDLYDRNHFIRYPANWGVIMKNISTLVDAGVKVGITQTISILNVYYLDEFYKFFTDKKLQVIPNFLHDPSFLSIANMPINIKSMIIEKLEKTLPHDTMSVIRARFCTGIENITEFNNDIEYLYKLSTIRNIDMFEIFPEFLTLVNNEQNNKHT